MPQSRQIPKSPGHPTQWHGVPVSRCESSVRLPIGRSYHGTRANLKPGDLIQPGHPPNFGNRDRTTPHVYLTRTLDAAIWGAELAAGEGPGRIYLVEPTGPIEEDPNLTNTKFRGESNEVISIAPAAAGYGRDYRLAGALT
jgi:hypothetical protein